VKEPQLKLKSLREVQNSFADIESLFNELSARLDWQYIATNNPTGHKRVVEVQTKSANLFRQSSKTLGEWEIEAEEDEEVSYLRGNHSMTSLIRKRQLLEARIEDCKDAITLIDQIIERKRTGTGTGQTK
jgi:hypothetical protein